MKKYVFILVVLCALVLIPVAKSCTGDEPIDDPENTVVPAMQITAPMNQEQYTVGDNIKLDLRVNKADEIDQIEVYFDDVLVASDLLIENQSIEIATLDSRVGKLQVRVDYKGQDGKLQQDVRSIILFSDIIPKMTELKVINKYPHDPKSYTQGLEFYKGNLFESTGQYGTSYVAETDLATGLIKRQVDLDPNYFGEGMTIINDTIYQITYRAGKCEVYDLGFNKINEFTYVGEGWGLTNDGEHLIMSNGSDEIVWRNRNTFEVERKIHVFDDKSSAVQLNELELINGKLFANIYTDSKIIEIDPSNGKILTYIDCSTIVDEQPIGVDYLNGIAYDSISNAIVMTGKLWPTLYEVSFE